MWLKYCLLTCTALTAAAVKVDLLGSLTLGSDVAEFLSYYLKDDVITRTNARRSMTDAFLELHKVVKQMQPCKNMPICNEKMQNLLIEYVADLILKVRSVFEGILDDELCKVRFFQKSLKHFKSVVRNATLDEDEVHRWINVLKRISGNFVEQSMSLVDAALNKNPDKILANRELRQQLVIKITDVERTYATKLCTQFTFCPYQYDATIYLQLLLNQIKIMNDTDVNVFLNLFRRNLQATSVFKTSEPTLKKFDDVLAEMFYEKSVPAKDIILSISDVVQKRLSTTEATEKDGLLLQMILADFDHLCVNNRHDPIQTFLDKVKAWMKGDDFQILVSGMEGFFSVMAADFNTQPEDLVFKLKMEILVFLDMTIDSNSKR